MEIEWRWFSCWCFPLVGAVRGVFERARSRDDGRHSAGGVPRRAMVWLVPRGVLSGSDDGRSGLYAGRTLQNYTITLQRTDGSSCGQIAIAGQGSWSEAEAGDNQ